MIDYAALIDDLKYEADKLPRKFSQNDELFQILTEARQAIAVLAGLNKDPDLEIKSCPFCGWRAPFLEEDRFGHYVVCTNCYARTGAFPSPARAIRAWNERSCREDFCPVND